MMGSCSASPKALTWNSVYESLALVGVVEGLDGAGPLEGLDGAGPLEGLDGAGPLGESLEGAEHAPDATVRPTFVR